MCQCSCRIVAPSWACVFRSDKYSAFTVGVFELSLLPDAKPTGTVVFVASVDVPPAAFVTRREADWRRAATMVA